MLNLFDSVFGGGTQNTLSVGLFLLCILIALICGVIYLAAFSFRDRGSRNMRMSLVLLPAAVSVVIMMAWRWRARSPWCGSGRHRETQRRFRSFLWRCVRG